MNGYKQGLLDGSNVPDFHDFVYPQNCRKVYLMCIVDTVSLDNV